jgi:hypothetical protein
MKHDSAHRIGRCVDQVPNSFSLNEIELSVEKRASCELTGVCLSRTRVENCRNDCFGNDQPAVGREFDRVITGVGTR